MPNDVAAALKSAGAKADYDARPAHQHNDYIGWIARAKEGRRGPGASDR